MDDKKTWSDIERAVYRSRLQQYQFSSFVPSHFTFYKNILIFLGIPPVGDTYTNENTLVYVDVEGGVWEHMEIQKPVGGEDNMNESSTHLYLSSKMQLLFGYLVSLFLTLFNFDVNININCNDSFKTSPILFFVICNECCLEVTVYVHMSGGGKVIEQKRIIVMMVISCFCE